MTCPDGDMEELPSGTRVTNPDYHYVGTVYGYETKFRTRWVIVKWDSRQLTARENPESIRPMDPSS